MMGKCPIGVRDKRQVALGALACVAPIGEGRFDGPGTVVLDRTKIDKLQSLSQLFILIPVSPRIV